MEPKRKRDVKYFVRGIDPNGKKWDSGKKYDTRDEAVNHLLEWRRSGYTGELKIMHWVSLLSS